MLIFSIIIPTHLRWRQLTNLLHSIEKQEFDLTQVQVLVVGNLFCRNLEKNLRKVLKRWPHWSLVFTGEMGVNRARNAGVKDAKGQLHLFLDDDCLLQDPKYLSRVEKVHRIYSEFTAVGGRYLLRDGATFVEEGYHHISDHWLTQSFVFIQRRGVFGEPIETRNLMGGNVCYKAKVFQEGHRFNEEIIFGGSETEFNFRLRKKGARFLFCHDLSVKHNLSLSVSSLIRKAWCQGKTEQVYLGRHFSYSDPHCVPSHHMNDHAHLARLKICFCIWIYRVFFRKGQQWAKMFEWKAHSTSVSARGVISFVVSLLVHRFVARPRDGVATDIYYVLKNS